MAPRGRRPARRERTARDAAIDQMRMYGFDDQVIRRELKKLLEIYGSDGWLFIESDSYKVLIDAILESQEEGAQPENGTRNETMEEEVTVDENEPVLVEKKEAVSVDKNVTSVEAAGAGTSSQHLPPSSSSVPETVAQPMDIVKKSNTSVEEISGTSSQHVPPSFSSVLEAVAQPMDFVNKSNTSVEEISGSSSQIVPPSFSSVLEAVAQPMDFDMQVPLSAPSPPVNKNPVPPQAAAPRRRRKPCYGWIDDSGDRDDEIILLTPAPCTLHGRSDNGHGEMTNEWKRKTRWDL